MQTSARIAAAADILSQLFAAWSEGRKAPADAVMERYFRARRFIGSKDRISVSENVYFVLRHLAALEWICAKTHPLYQENDFIPKSSEDSGYRATAGSAGGGLGGSYPQVFACEGYIKKSVTLAVAAAILRKDASAEYIVASSGSGPYSLPSATDADKRHAQTVGGAALNDPAMPPHVLLNFPSWMESDLRESLGDGLAEEMAAMLNQAPVDVRVNTLKTRREDLLSTFDLEGFSPEPTPFSPVGIRLRGRKALFASRMFKDGLFEMQDEGSQIAALLVDAAPGMKIIDFCAGSGGKTLAMAACMRNKGRILAWDISEKRMRDLKERLRRAGVSNVESRAIASESDAYIKRHKESADRVLVDAPCSGTGTWRRNPDLKWRMKESDIAELVAVQSRIIKSASRLVKPGGRLVYVTCSMLKRENDQQVEDFIHAHGNFMVVDVREIWKKCVHQDVVVDGRFLSLTPQKDGTDGFFASVLERVA